VPKNPEVQMSRVAQGDVPQRKRGLLAKILSTGRVAERTPDTHDPANPESRRGEIARQLGGSIQIRHVDCGSCNGCELETISTFGPVFDAGRYGLGQVASPRHADALLVTGPVTKNMATPLRKTLGSVPEPRLVIALGDCAIDGGVFADGYGVEGPVSAVVDVHLEIPGCPPHPDAIIAALRGLIDS